MALTIAVNQNGGMYLTAGNITMKRNADAVAQDTVTAMRTLRGEMQYETQGGMPYFQTAFNKYKPRAFEAAARGVISQVPGVVRVTEFAVALTNDELQYSATIETIYGTVFING